MRSCSGHEQCDGCRTAQRNKTNSRTIWAGSTGRVSIVGPANNTLSKQNRVSKFLLMGPLSSLFRTMLDIGASSAATQNRRPGANKALPLVCPREEGQTVRNSLYARKGQKQTIINRGGRAKPGTWYDASACSESQKGWSANALLEPQQFHVKGEHGIWWDDARVAH